MNGRRLPLLMLLIALSTDIVRCHLVSEVHESFNFPHLRQITHNTVSSASAAASSAYSEMKNYIGNFRTNLKRTFSQNVGLPLNIDGEVPLVFAAENAIRPGQNLVFGQRTESEVSSAAAAAAASQTNAERVVEEDLPYKR